MMIAEATERVPLATDGEGVVRVGGTRVTLESVLGAFQQGATAEEIVQQYPTLDLADVYATLGFCLRHREEVEGYLKESREQAAAVRRENERRHPAPGIRERLLARRERQSPAQP